MRLPALIVVFLALACAPAANAQFERAVAGGESLALEGGRGVATVTSQEGAMLARVRRGAIRVVRPRGSETELGLYGCERRRNVGRAVVCAGRHLRLRVLGGSWQVRLRGAGIYGAGRLQGSVTLRGSAGTYSIDYADERRWPRRARTFRVG